MTNSWHFVPQKADYRVLAAYAHRRKITTKMYKNLIGDMAMQLPLTVLIVYFNFHNLLIVYKKQT